MVVVSAFLECRARPVPAAVFTIIAEDCRKRNRSFIMTISGKQPQTFLTRALAILTALVCLFTLCAHADEIFLKSGGRLEGDIQEGTDGVIKIDVIGMGVLEVDKTRIESVRRSAIRRVPTQTPTELSPTPTETATEIMVPPSATPPPPVEATPIIGKMSPTNTKTSTQTPTATEAADIAERANDSTGYEYPFLQEPSVEEENTVLSFLEKLDIFSSGPGRLAAIIWRIFVIFMCIKMGEKKGHSMLACILYGFFFGIFGLIIVNFQPGTAPFVAIGCCILYLLIIVLVVVLGVFAVTQGVKEAAESPELFLPEPPPSEQGKQGLGIRGWGLAEI
jgi:hypothetical protein